jgi:hypothetical protein
MAAGRPKEGIETLPENWYIEVISMYKEGASDVEIKAFIYEIRGSFSNDLWDRWIADEPEFREAIYEGRKIRPFIRVNDTEKHKNKLEIRRKTRYIDYQGDNKIVQSFRSLFYYHIKNTSAKVIGSKFNFLGYKKEDLINHIKLNLKDGMSINNYGKWHIDHIKPASWFNHNNIEEVKECWALSNLEPKWAFDNISKGNRFEG